MLRGERLANIKPRGGAFLALVRAIIYQQISTKAGDSISRKFCAVFAPSRPTPEAVLKLKAKDFRQAGVSNQKMGYLIDLARKFLDGTVVPKKFSRMTDNEIRTHLIAVKGIGPWTADMFLIFTLKRPNVLPLLDLGIKNGFKKYFNLRNLPDEKKMLQLAKPYDGQYTELALFLWDFKDNH